MGTSVFTADYSVQSTNVANTNLQDLDIQDEFVYGNNSRVEGERLGLLSGDSSKVGGDLTINYGDADLTGRLLDIFEDGDRDSPGVTVVGDVSGSLGVTDSSSSADTTTRTVNSLPLWVKIIGGGLLAYLAFKAVK